MKTGTSVTPARGNVQTKCMVFRRLLDFALRVRRGEADGGARPVTPAYTGQPHNNQRIKRRDKQTLNDKQGGGGVGRTDVVLSNAAKVSSIGGE